MLPDLAPAAAAAGGPGPTSWLRDKLLHLSWKAGARVHSDKYTITIYLVLRPTNEIYWGGKEDVTRMS